MSSTLSEFGQKIERLAKALYEIPHGPGSYNDADLEDVENYEADASQILFDYPHLLSYGERERLADLGHEELRVR